MKTKQKLESILNKAQQYLPGNKYNLKEGASEVVGYAVYRDALVYLFYVNGRLMAGILNSFSPLMDWQKGPVYVYQDRYPLKRATKKDFDHYRVHLSKNYNLNTWGVLPESVTSDETKKLSESIKLEKLQTVEITYEDGSTSETSVSDKVDQKDIEDYFVGQKFNLAAYPREKMVKAVSVRFVENKDLKEFARPLITPTEDEEIIEQDGIQILINRKKLTAKGYSGNRAKPDFFYRFRNETQLENHVKEYLAKKERDAKEIENWRNQKKVRASELIQTTEIGDIFYTSWGYEQTNSEFYQVVDKKGSTFTFQEIDHDLKTGGGNSMSGTIMPIQDKFIGKPIRVIVRNDYPKIGRQYLNKWDGHPVSISWYA